MSAPLATRPARPYPGLRPFEAEEWSIFFGRERMIDEVIERLALNGLVLIHGASGSGKSSLVRAGVMPKLARQHQRHGAPWLTCAMRPSGGPLWNLATEFARWEGRGDDFERIGALAGAFNARGATLASVAASLVGCQGKSFCLLVDQFEEVFRFAKETSREEAELFVDLIGRAANGGTEAVDLHVVVTMRSEFLGECARFAGLAETINRTQYLVPRMDDEALPRAVRRPAQMYGGSVSADLADRLIASVRGREDELPLLQHGLMLMWDEALAKAPPGDRPELDGAMVDAAGGLAELLSRHADAVMQAAAPDARRAAIVESLFRALTDVNAEGSAIRRPQSFRALCAVMGASPEELRPILDAFRAPGVSFLTPFAPAPIGEATRIDISHEALIRCWRRIASGEEGWLKREFDEGLAWRSLLVEADAFVRDPERVLSPAATEDRSKLFATRGEAWSLRYGGGWPRVGALLEASRKAAASARRRSRGAAAALCVLTMGALVAAWFSLVELQKEQKAEETAQAEKLEALTQAAKAEEQRQNAEARRNEAVAQKAKADQQNEISNMFLSSIEITGASRAPGGSLARALFAKTKVAAEQGNTSAAKFLGILYEKGIGVPVDYRIAHDWFEKAAAAGDGFAVNDIGALYASGLGVPQDYAKARALYEKAAAAGVALAMRNLGDLAENGQGVPRDYSSARAWYEKAAAAGNVDALRDLGLIYANALGVPQDYAKARAWYEKAAAAGNVDALRDLGILYVNGEGVAQDYAKAREWFEKAAAAGNVDALRDLGIIYGNGQGVARDYAKARALYEQAAAAGNVDALRDLGFMYANALGVAQDYVKARELYEKAAAAGNAEALHDLGILYWNGEGVARDYARARELYEKAAAAGNVDAMNDLGAMYRDSEGVAQDYVKARAWFEKAAAVGNSYAMGILADMDASGQGGPRDYAKALFWSDKSASAIEANEVAADGKPGVKTAEALGGVSWYALFALDFARALASAERAHQLAPDFLMSETNHAHALMFVNRIDEARALYLAHRDDLIASSDNKPWRKAILDDFAEFRKAGLGSPLMDEIEAAFLNK